MDQTIVKIGIIGCGALGSYYGAMLRRIGLEVHFLLRSDFEHVSQHGVRIESPNGSFHVHPHAHRSGHTIGACDLVLVGLKTTANQALKPLLEPLMGPKTQVLTLQNGLGNEQALANLVPASRILGGLCFVCLNRISPGVIQHLDHGLIVLGEWESSTTRRLEEVQALLQSADIPCQVTSNLMQAHWEKLLWNIPFNGLGVAARLGHLAFDGDPTQLEQLEEGTCLDAGKLLNDRRWLMRIKQLMQEVMHVAQSLGYSIDPSLPDQLIAKTRTMGSYRASTLIDFERGDPLEMDSLFSQPLDCARSANVPTPILERLVATLHELEARREKGGLSSGDAIRMKT